MTTPTVHPYSLRARTGKTAVAKASVDAASTFDNEIPDSTSAIGTSPVTRRQFSDVVSGRECPTSQGGQALVYNTSDEGSYLKYDKTNLGIVSYETPDNRNARNLIPPRHSRSHSSSTRAGLASDEIMNPKRSKLRDTAPAVDPVAAAEELLTAAHRNTIERRYQHVANKQLRPTSPASRGEGPSKSKVNPVNWGDACLSEEELDLEAQQAALDLLKRDLLTRKAERASKDAGRVKKTVRGGSTSQTPAQHDLLPITRKVDNRPIRQIPLNSYIGQTLKNLHRLGTPKRRTGNDPSSSSSSDSSEPSSEPESSENDGNSHREKSPAHQRHSRSKGKRQSQSKRSHKSGLKPIAPKEYNGAADARAYNRFVTEGTTYVRDGRVPRNRQVFVLSYYLDGIAYDFYTQKVSMNFAKWRLQEFFEELFNYCFPVDYRMKQRLKLKRCFQNETKVSAYVHELEELYNMIGAADEREKVIKLWDGLRSSIQQGLWRDQLNPETSTWEEVADHASVLEIAYSVSEPDEDSDAEYSSTAEYNSDLEGQSDPEYAPNPPEDNHLRNPSGKHRGFQSNQPGSQVLPRTSSEQHHLPRENGDLGSSHPPSSNFAIFGNRASSRGTSDSRFIPKPFEPTRTNIKEEKAELMASGKCFTCREVGHLARDCPNENIKRLSSSEPPGISNFNIQLGVLDRENSNEVEHLYSLQVSIMTVFPDEESTISTSDWGACNPQARPLEINLRDSPETLTEDAIASTNHTRSSLLNVHTLDFSEETDIPLELGAQREVEPCAAHPIGDVCLGKDLEGARFTLADLQNSVYVISDDRHHGKNDCFAFRGPRQRKEGEGETVVPHSGFQSPQIFFGSIPVKSITPNL